MDATVNQIKARFSSASDEWGTPRELYDELDNIRSFLERAHQADMAVFLIPSRTDVRWFHEIVLPEAKEIRFIRGRIQFSGRVKDNAPFPSMIVIFERRS
jgi:hypothetical protein